MMICLKEQKLTEESVARRGGKRRKKKSFELKNGAERSKYKKGKEQERSDVRDQSGGDWFIQEPLGFCSIRSED